MEKEAQPIGELPGGISPKITPYLAANLLSRRHVSHAIASSIPVSNMPRYHEEPEWKFREIEGRLQPTAACLHRAINTSASLFDYSLASCLPLAKAEGPRKNVSSFFRVFLNISTDRSDRGHPRDIIQKPSRPSRPISLILR